MALPQSASDRLLSTVLLLSQYPILASQIRELMRQELFSQHILEPDDFKLEVQQKAIQSQEREGLTDPTVQEPGEVWEKRKALVADDLILKYNGLCFSVKELYDEVMNRLSGDGGTK